MYIYILYDMRQRAKRRKKKSVNVRCCRDEMWWFDYLYLLSGLLFFFLIWLELIRLSLTPITLFRTTSINYLIRRCFSFVIVSTSAMNKMLLSNMPTHISTLWHSINIDFEEKKRKGKITNRYRMFWIIIIFRLTIAIWILIRCPYQQLKHWANLWMIVLEQPIVFLAIHHYQVMLHRFE
jgi:hypothetical protein